MALRRKPLKKKVEKKQEQPEKKQEESLKIVIGSKVHLHQPEGCYDGMIINSSKEGQLVKGTTPAKDTWIRKNLQYSKAKRPETWHFADDCQG